MKTAAGITLLSTLTICLIATLTIPGSTDDHTMWYRGYFDGQVTLKSGPVPGYYYQPSRPTAYPLNEHLLSDPLPCDKCGYYHPAGGYCRELGRICDGNGTHYDRDRVLTPAWHPLPGQYWREKQNHWTWRTPITVGRPYMKYDQRTEPTGSITVGRRTHDRLRRRR